MKTYKFYNFLPLKPTIFNAIVIYPFMFFKHKKGEVPVWTLKHELQHIYQIQSYGAFKFYYLYLKHYVVNLIKHKNLKQAYLAVRYESEARYVQDDGLTDDEREFYDI